MEKKKNPNSNNIPPKKPPNKQTNKPNNNNNKETNQPINQLKDKKLKSINYSCWKLPFLLIFTGTKTLQTRKII